MTAPAHLDAARDQANRLGEKAASLLGKLDDISLRERARCLLAVSYSADLLEKHGSASERGHWHDVGTDAERQAAAVFLRLCQRSLAAQAGFAVIEGGRR